MSKVASRPISRRTILYATIAVVVLGAIVAVGLASRVPQSATTVNQKAKLTIGQDAPSFAVSTNAGPFDLANVKTPVFLEVFATWCPHCQHEVKVLNGLYGQYGSRVHFVGVSGSEQGMDGTTAASQADVLAFVQKFGVRYPVAYDGDLTVAKKYLQGGFPTIVVIGSDNKIRAVRDGEISPKQLTGDLDSALKG